jgi:hypothetical protein
VTLLAGLLLLPALAWAAPVPEDEVDGFAKALKSKNPAVRKQAAIALGELGAKAKTAVPALRQALLDADEGVQAAAADALDKVAPGAAPAGGAGDKRLKEKMERMQAELREAQARAEQALAESERARAVAEQARAAERRARAVAEDQRAQAEKKAEELAKGARQLRDARVAAEIEAKALKDRNERLLRQVEELTKELAKVRGGKELLAPESNPPAEMLEGLVKKVGEEGLVVIGIGSDAGLQKGHTLEVYRLKPQPKYLGTVRIVDVRPTEAVARPVGKLREPLQEGDKVASKVTGR